MFPTVDALLEREVARLPLRALVALTLRGARRAQFFFEVLPFDPERLVHYRAVDAALTLAEAFAAGQDNDEEFANFDARISEPVLDAQLAASAESAKEAAVAASIVAIAARIARGGQTPGNVVPCALSSLQRSAQAIAAAFPARVHHIRGWHAFLLGRDFGRLVALKPGASPDLGLGVDATETGPLATWWPECVWGEGWYVQGQTRLRRARLPGAASDDRVTPSTAEAPASPAAQ